MVKKNIQSRLIYCQKHDLEIKIILDNKLSFCGSIVDIAQDYLLILGKHDKELRLFPLEKILYFVLKDEEL